MAGRVTQYASHLGQETSVDVTLGCYQVNKHFPMYIEYKLLGIFALDMLCFLITCVW